MWMGPPLSFPHCVKEQIYNAIKQLFDCPVCTLSQPGLRDEKQLATRLKQLLSVLWFWQNECRSKH